MRCRISCQKFTRRAPIRLVANSAGQEHDHQRHHARPCPACAGRASSRCGIPAAAAAAIWSSASTISFSTQIVMTSGIQISRPVMRYFFMCWKQKSPAQLPGPCAGPLMVNSWCWPASSSPAWLRSSLRSWFRTSPRSSLPVFVSAFASGLASAFASAFLPLLLKSVAYQPTPFNWKPAAVSCFAIFLLAAGRALGQRRLAQLLQVVFLVAAGRARYS